MIQVDVYKNLHQDKWSIKDRKSGRVIGHANQVTIIDATFIVQPAGRARVLKEKRKNVHAFVRGTLVSTGGFMATGNMRKVTYDPYKADHFTTETGQRIDTADTVELAHGAVYAYTIPAMVTNTGIVLDVNIDAIAGSQHEIEVLVNDLLNDIEQLQQQDRYKKLSITASVADHGEFQPYED